MQILPCTKSFGDVPEICLPISFFSSLTSILPLQPLVCSHGLCHAAPETSLTNGCHDLCLCMLQHFYYIREGWPDIWIGIPTTSHDLSKDRRAVRRDCGADAFVDHCKCCLNCSHFVKGKHARYEFPKYYSKAVHINLLGVGPMLDHFPVESNETM